MCGFVTLFSDEPIGITATYKLNRMTEMIKHRGPDEREFYMDRHMYMGFQRLSIIDISKGQQPFAYAQGAYQVVFNGEIYNYVELREQLIKEGVTFVTDSDTEVLIAMYHRYGSNMVKMLRGMFAFVIWDKQKGQIFGGRDPFGIKPFFYKETKEALYCSSEKKSLLLTEDGDKVIDAEALHHYFTYQYVPEPDTLLKNISILKPGHTISKKLGQKSQIKPYTSIQFNPTRSSLSVKCQAIRNALEDSVSLHMRSDVPLGTFLSGGVDSTIIAALAKERKADIKSFTVGFDKEGYSEISLAKQTAGELGITNISKVITAEEFLKELPKIIWHMDSPVADPASIPLYFVSRLASRHVKVVLSGEGADELFGGYNIYREPDSLKLFSYLPKPAKKILGDISAQLPEGMRGKSFLERGSMSIEERYYGNARIFIQKEREQLLLQFQKEFTKELITGPLYREAAKYDDLTKMQYIDIHTWLRGDILVKADRMTMAHSIEGRVPFLDREVMAAAAELSKKDKVNKLATKYALREAFQDILPPFAKDRKKLGFPVPIRHWLKEEMYDWARALIFHSETDRILNKKYCLQLLEAHRVGEVDYSRRIWTILTFLLWHQVFVENKYNFHQQELEQGQSLTA